jgi:hypothetical protein
MDRRASACWVRTEAGQLVSSSMGVSAAVGRAPLAVVCAGVAVALLGPPLVAQLRKTLCQGGGGDLLLSAGDDQAATDGCCPVSSQSG